MNGFERLDDMMKNQKDGALIQTVEYLKTRKDMEQRFLNEEKDIESMCNYIQEKGRHHTNKGWGYITNEVVFAWAIVYFSLPNSILNIKNSNIKNISKNDTATSLSQTKNNVISMEKAKEKIKKEKVAQLSLFGEAL